MCPGKPHSIADKTHLYAIASVGHKLVPRFFDDADPSFRYDLYSGLDILMLLVTLKCDGVARLVFQKTRIIAAILKSGNIALSRTYTSRW